MDRFLTVQVETDQDEYRPGQDCRTTIRVLDVQNRPVADCEISLGVVDEAIYALKEDDTPDIREFFHKYQRPFAIQEAFFFRARWQSFTIWKVPVFIRGAMNVHDIVGVGGGGRFGSRRSHLVSGGGGRRNRSGILERADFRDTAFWQAHLRTGGDGTAVVTFPFPDNLTSFRFTARGITKDHKVGAVKQRAVVRKDFFTRLVHPRVLQEGNTLALSALVHNVE